MGVNYRFYETVCFILGEILRFFHMPESSRPKILLLIPHLGGGGAERVTALLAGGLSPDKYELHLGLITQASSDGVTLPPSVQIHPLGASRVRAGAFRLLRLVRRLKPDLILSGMFHLNFLVLLLRPFFPHKTRVLVRQNGTVSATSAFGGLSWTTRLLYRLLYNRSDRVICQTLSMAEELAREIGVRKSRLVVLPNPVDVEGVRNSIGLNPAEWNGSGPHLLAVGRLSREKGFDLLLRAFAVVQRQFPDANLLIAGAGPEEAALKAQSHALGLDAAVCFAGYLASPWTHFSAATLFVLSSRHEGMPNVLLEAAAGGLPIVALPASGGLVGLVRHQLGVWLAPEISAEALADSLLSALHALRPGERFVHPFVEEFRMERALQTYECLIDQALEQKRQ
jgi:glycosyltransferase involved in cell wall biosynthesis